MKTLNSTYFLNNYSNFIKIRKPICLTRGGKRDIVVMSFEYYRLLKLKEHLLDIELEQSSGANYYSLEELDSSLKKKIS